MATAAYFTYRSKCAAIARISADGTAEVQRRQRHGTGDLHLDDPDCRGCAGPAVAAGAILAWRQPLPPAPAHSASRTTASVGSAVFTVANMLRDKFIRAAVTDPQSPLAGLRPEDVLVTNGHMFSTVATDGPARGESYQDLLRRRGWPALESEQTWTPDDADKRYSTYAYGAVFAEVAIDALLPTVRIRRIYACYDAGRVINPKLAHSQAIGGMIGGIGMALLEGPSWITETVASLTRTSRITWSRSTPTLRRWTQVFCPHRTASPTRSG